MTSAYLSDDDTRARVLEIRKKGDVHPILIYADLLCVSRSISNRSL